MIITAKSCLIGNFRCCLLRSTKHLSSTFQTDITDQFCNPIDLQKNMNSLNGEIYSEGKIHEQPIVSFVQKENEQEVIYREEM